MSSCILLASPAAAQTHAGDSARRHVTAERRSPDGRRELLAVAVSGSFRLDGALDDEVWRRARPATGFVQSEPREGQPATEETEVSIAYDEQNLYVGAFMRDSDPAHEVVNDIRKDFREDDQDDFEVILDTFRDRRNGYIFITNPAGGRVDRQISNEGREINSSWDALWEVRTQRRSDGWSAELRIPFRTLRFEPGANQAWGINFARRIRRKNEVTFWSPVPRSFNLMRLSRAGDLVGLEVGAAGRDIRVKPYVLGNSARDIGVSTSDQKVDAGLDLKLAVTRGLTLDATVRPDFAQVEADEQQVNLTQFTQFFPEKREAFLENSGIFYVGDAARLNRVFVPATPDDDNLLFFSRRIGIRDDRRPLAIDAGGRLTGMAGDFGIGLINMQVRGDGVTDDNNYSVLRLRRNVAQGSDIGVLFMQRQSTDDAHNYNRVAGLDANIRFAGRLDWNSYVVGTRTPGLSGGQYSARTSLNWEGNFFHGKAGVMSLGEHFNNDLGFYRRVGVKKWFTDIGVRPRPEVLRRRGIRELHPHIVWDLYASQTNHMVQKRLHTGQTFFFENGAVVELSYNPAFNLLEQPLRLSSGVDSLPAGPYGWNEYGLLANTDQSRKLSLSSRWTVGGLYNGTQRSVTASVTFRPNYRIRVSTGMQRTAGDLDLPNGKFVSAFWTTRANYSFSPNMFIDALSQYDPSSKQLNANVRFNLIHHPLSDLFIVYNDQRFLTADAPVGGRSLIVKVTQMMAF
ncbi:MAG: DUF5916 domain-containing protein [Gemmatimonadaceae bacterium]